jgi:hypothetical protein
MAANKNTGGLAPDFTPPAIEREPMREAAPSFEDHFARAAARMEQLRGVHGNEILDTGTDEFYIDSSDIPPGWDYQWKRVSLLGKEDPAYQVQLARGGWWPVPTKRHPHFMPLDTDSPTITRKGMMLMERPMELTREAQRIERDRARNQVRIKEQQLAQAPAGQFERDNEGSSLASIKKTHVPMPVPE